MQETLSYNMCSPPIKDEKRHCDKEITGWTQLESGSIMEGILPFPFPEDLPDPGIKPRSPALQADSLPPEPPGKTLSIKWECS